MCLLQPAQNNQYSESSRALKILSAGRMWRAGW